jgi:Cu-processing system permease protein
VLTILFAALSLVYSVVAALQAGQGEALGGFQSTVLGMITISAFLLPILCLMISYATVAGERESGSLQLLLTMPVTRFEVFLGKVLGLTAVVSFSFLLGLGVAAVAIVALAGPEGIDQFAVFLLGGVLTAFCFVCIGTAFSSLVQRRSTALGLAVFLWFFFVLIWGTILVGIFLATGGTLEAMLAGDLPAWYFAVDMLSPSEAFSLFGALAFNVTDFQGVSVTLPAYVNLYSVSAVLATWAVVPLVLASWRFGRIDL